MKNLTECARRITLNEGCELKVYTDTTGHPTIGVGLLLDGNGLQALKDVGVPDPKAVLEGKVSITQEQAEKALEWVLPRYVQYAREALSPGAFDTLSEARQCALVDMSYNLGQLRYVFPTSISLINEAQINKNAGHDELAHDQFLQAAHNLSVSLWAKQVGDRAKRDIQMLISGEYVPA